MRMCLMSCLLVMLFCTLAALADDSGGRGRNKRIFVVPAPGPVTIDGRLDDWDLSGQILIFPTQEVSSLMNARIAMMYDAQALYVSGIVRDSSPMMNRHDPRVDADRGWDGDAFQLRLALDPAMGYPVDIRGYNEQIVHILCWYYTDGKLPVLQLAYGMNYQLPKTGWPQGVVPADKFQGAYRLTDDKTGYIFEYRIPWSTLGAKRPLQGGDLVASSLQVQWGAPDGLSITGGSFAYDVMGTPGFAFQSTACWGKAIFTKSGHLPGELTQGEATVDAPQPLALSYTLPGDGEVSLALLNEKGQYVRHLLAQAPRKQGPVTEHWDGLDDAGKPLSVGTYTWKGLYHAPITTHYRLSVHNSGQPPFLTADGTGGWGADHGTPQTVCAYGDAMLLAWNVAEAGWGLLRTDLNGKRVWGIRQGALHLACDGERIFASGGGGFYDGSGVQLFAFSDGRPLNFGRRHSKGGSAALRR